MSKFCVHVLVFLVCLSCCVESLASPACATLPIDTTLGSLVPIEQIEKEHLLVKKAADDSLLPSAYGRQSEWLQWYAKLQPRDQIFLFTHSATSEGGHAYFYGGYAAFRGKCLIGMVQTWVT